MSKSRKKKKKDEGFRLRMKHRKGGEWEKIESVSNICSLGKGEFSRVKRGTAKTG